MDLKTIGAIIAAVAAIVTIVGGLIAFLKYRRERRQQFPVLRIDDTTLILAGRPPSVGDAPVEIHVTLTNVGGGLATEVDVSVWYLIVKTERYSVPSDETLGRPHFAAHQAAIRAGETLSITALRSGMAFHAGAIPGYDPDAFGLVKATVKYRDQFKKQFVERAVNAGEPSGTYVLGVDHSPLPKHGETRPASDR